MDVVHSFPIIPPSGVRGWLEALIGRLGAMDEKGNRFAYGLAHGPEATGLLVRLDHVWSSAGARVPVVDEEGKPVYRRHTRGAQKGEIMLDKDGKPLPKLRLSGEATRPVKRHTFFHLEYQVVVDGPIEKEVLEALVNPTGGGRYLGDSDSPIWWLAVSDRKAKWLVPGRQMVLPIRSGYGYGRLNAVYRTWDLTDKGSHIPDEAWIDAEPEEEDKE
jgi:hypothetical protein